MADIRFTDADVEEWRDRLDDPDDAEEIITLFGLTASNLLDWRDAALTVLKAIANGSEIDHDEIRRLIDATEETESEVEAVAEPATKTFFVTIPFNRMPK